MASHESSGKNNNDYINQLIEEKKNLNSNFSLAYKLLQQEIDRTRNGESGNDTQRNDSHVVVHTGKQIRLKVKVHIPVDEHPSFNFVGKLLGPKGSSLQHLQECSQTRMAILGRGSMRDKRKEEELRTGGDPKYNHLNEALHVEVSAYAPAAEAYRRVSLAFNELQRFLVPDPVPFGQEQEYYDDMRPPQYMNEGKKPPYAGGEPPHPRGGGMHPPRPPMGPPMGGGREPPRGRSAQSTYPAQEAEEWGAPAPRPSPRRGGYNAAPAPPARAVRSYEEPVSDYNSYGDGYGEYREAGNASAYYDYAADPEPSYNDGYPEYKYDDQPQSGLLNYPSEGSARKAPLISTKPQKKYPLLREPTESYATRNGKKNIPLLKEPTVSYGQKNGKRNTPLLKEPSNSYNEESRGPMRNAGAPRGGGGRNNARAQAHPYSGATRRGY